MNKNVEQSRLLAKRVRAIPKSCWRNASRALLNVPGYEDATYVEGVAVHPCGLATEHGWVEHRGEVLDPTLPDHECLYFPGLRFQGRAGLCRAIDAIPRKKGDPDVPLFFRFGWGGADSLEVCRAW